MLEQAGGGAFFVLVAIALAVLCAFAILEAWMLFTRRRPITQYVRGGIETRPKVAVAIAFVLGVIGGHFWR